MKIDLGFWDENGQYKEDIQEIEMLSVKELNEIELIKAQNEGLKKQNENLQESLNKVKTKLNEFADKFDCINDYVDEVHIHYEDETGGCCGIEDAIWGFELVKLQELLRDFIDFVEEIK